MLVAEIAAGVELASAAARKPADTAASETKRHYTKQHSKVTNAPSAPHLFTLFLLFTLATKSET